MVLSVLGFNILLFLVMLIVPTVICSLVWFIFRKYFVSRKIFGIICMILLFLIIVLIELGIMIPLYNAAYD